MSISVNRSSKQPFSCIFTKISIGSISNGVCERRTAGSNFKYSLEFEPKNDVTSAIYAQVAKME